MQNHDISRPGTVQHTICHMQIMRGCWLPIEIVYNGPDEMIFLTHVLFAVGVYCVPQ